LCSVEYVEIVSEETAVRISVDVSLSNILSPSDQEHWVVFTTRSSRLESLKGSLSFPFHVISYFLLSSLALQIKVVFLIYM
jgi:hypothetical protein